MTDIMADIFISSLRVCLVGRCFTFFIRSASKQWRAFVPIKHMEVRVLLLLDCLPACWSWHSPRPFV